MPASHASSPLEARARRPRPAAVLSIALAVVLGACSGGGAGSAPPTASDNGASSGAPAPSAPASPASAAFPDSPSAAEDAGPLSLLEWSGYELDQFHAPFTAAHADVQLDYQFADGGAAFFSKVQTGGAQVDIAHPCSNWVQTWVDNDLLAPIDTSRLENWERLDPTMRELGKVGDQVYFVPWDWGFDSMIVNTDTVQDVPTSWKDLWDPKYKGRIALEDYGEVMVALAAAAWGMDYPNLSEQDLEVVKQKLIELKSNVKTFWTSASEVAQLMSNGEVDMAYGWPDTYAQVLDAGVKATYIEPSEGRAGWVCGFVVPKSTQHYDLALDYIDASISPEVGASLIDEYFLGHPNLDALALADPANVKTLQLDQLDVRERTRFAAPLTDEQRETFNRLWAEVVAGG
jgi:spermidine/putrescine transport system substrate-binding protein